MLGWTTFEKYDINVVTLLEEIQLEWLSTYIREERKMDLSIIFKEYPYIYWFMTNKAPKAKQVFEDIKNLNAESDEDINIIVQRFLQSMEDWLVYVIDPDIYDSQSFNSWDTNELLSITDFNDKVVVDIGAGTGSQTFRVAPYAKHVYSVEPIGNLRKYLREKASKLKYNHISVIDGLMTRIPLEDNFTDILVSGHVFGDEPEKEFKEVMRVVKPGGYMILMPGNNDSDNDIHAFLVKQGCEWGRFEEPGDGIKRKYWIQKR